MPPGQKTKTENRNNTVTNSIKTLKKKKSERHYRAKKNLKERKKKGSNSELHRKGINLEDEVLA